MRFVITLNVTYTEKVKENEKKQEEITRNHGHKFAFTYDKLVNNVEDAIPLLKAIQQAVEQTYSEISKVTSLNKNYSYDIQLASSSGGLEAKNSSEHSEEKVVIHSDGTLEMDKTPSTTMHPLRYLWIGARCLQYAKGFLGAVSYSTATAKKPHLPKKVHGLTFLFSVLSAAKAYSGTTGFLETHLKFHNIIGKAITAIYFALPSIEFNRESMNNISGLILEKIQKKIGEDEKCKAIQLEFNLAISGTFKGIPPQIGYQVWEWVSKIILGFFYGLANFGMVLDQFPADFTSEEYPWIKWVILSAIMIVNQAIGTHKTDKLNSDLKALLSTGDPTFYDEALLIRAMSVFHGLGLKAGRGIFNSEEAKLKRNLRKLVSTNPLQEALNHIKAAVGTLCALQDAHSTEIAVSAAEDEDSLKREQRTNSNSSNYNGEFVKPGFTGEATMRLLDHSPQGSDLESPTESKETKGDSKSEPQHPFNYTYVFKDQRPIAEPLLGLASAGIAWSAIISNVAGVASILEKVMDPTVAWIIAIGMTVSVYALNKEDTDKLRDLVLQNINPTLQASYNPQKKNLCKKLFAPSNILGGLTSAGASVSGLFFSMVGAQKIGCALGGQLYFGACSFLLTTTTKAKAIATGFSKIFSCCCAGACCACCANDPEAKMDDFTNFLHQQNQILFEGTGEYISKYNKALKKLTREELAISGFKPITVNEEAQAVNDLLKNLTTIESAHKTLTEQFDKYRQKYWLVSKYPTVHRTLPFDHLETKSESTNGLRHRTPSPSSN